MGDIALCFEIKSPELLALLERNTSPDSRDGRFNRPRLIKPERFGLNRREDYRGWITYEDNESPKRIFAEPQGKFYTDIEPSKSHTLIRRILNKAMEREITFEGPNADLVLHGIYVGNERKYTPARELSPEFLKS